MLEAGTTELWLEIYFSPGSASFAYSIDRDEFVFVGTSAVMADDSVADVSLVGGLRGDHRTRARHRGERLRVLHAAVVDELGEVFDAVDVVHRWRGDQADAYACESSAGDLGIDLHAHELATLAGLGPLGDLDLVAGDEVFGGHAKTTRGDLLGHGGDAVAEVVRGLAALAAAAAPTHRPHRDENVAL